MVSVVNVGKSCNDEPDKHLHGDNDEMLKILFPNLNQNFHRPVLTRFDHLSPRIHWQAMKIIHHERENNESIKQ